MTDTVTERLETALTRDAGIEIPVICGAMYPCSNPKLVAAASEAGGIGIVQPLSLTYVHGHDFRDGLRLIRRMTRKPVGMNALIEQSSRRYRDRMDRWIDTALEEGLRFFVTSLGKPDRVAERVHSAGGVVYHDVTERKWALKGLDGHVDGFICVNSHAGGHAGGKDMLALYNEIVDLEKPMVCAGGIGCETSFIEALETGYAGVQMGTRFIATPECRAGLPYKNAIVRAGEDDIVHSEKITGVPVSVINTPYIQGIGTEAGAVARQLLRGRSTKHFMRTLYAIRSIWQLKHASLDEMAGREYWQAGRSVADIHSIEPVASIMRRFSATARGSVRKQSRKDGVLPQVSE